MLAAYDPKPGERRIYLLTGPHLTPLHLILPPSIACPPHSHSSPKHSAVHISYTTLQPPTPPAPPTSRTRLLCHVSLEAAIFHRLHSLWSLMSACLTPPFPLPHVAERLPAAAWRRVPLQRWECSPQLPSRSREEASAGRGGRGEKPSRQAVAPLSGSAHLSRFLR